jgi:transposase
VNIISVLPYTIEGFEISQVTSSETAIQIYACSQRSQANCPSCGQPSASKHGWYSRQPQDISTVGRHLRLFLKVKRFRCQNKQCKRRTFAEQMPSWLPAYARRTQSLTNLMRRFALEIGAETSHRLLKQLEIDVSGDTLLRILRRFEQSQVLKEHFKVIGVDDWAFKRGKTYGTIIVNLESHQVIDLLPDRSAETLAACLETHPNIEIVARDRSSEYSAGIRRAAPEAIQVADRWHLLLNLRQMLERYLTSIYAQLQTLPISEAYQQVLAQQRPAFRRTKTEQMASMRSREGRLALYEQIQQLRQSGASLAQITACLDSHPITITKYFYASSFPERKPRKPSKSILDPFIPYLEQRLLEGCENAQQLWREIRDQGYPGGNKQVRQWLQMKRTMVSPSTPHAHQYHLPAQILQTRLPSSKQIHGSWFENPRFYCLKTKFCCRICNKAVSLLLSISMPRIL